MPFFHKAFAKLILGLALCSTPLSAQEPELLAPRAEKDGRLYDVMISVRGYGTSADYRNPDFRKPEALTEPSTWLDADSVIVRSLRSDAFAFRSVTLALQIDAAGRIADCAMDGAGRFDFTEQQLCDEVQSRRFLPGLSEQGERQSGSYTLQIRQHALRTEADAPRRALIDTRPPIPLVSPEPSSSLDRFAFPPDGRWMHYYYREPDTWAEEPSRDWQTLPPSEATFGIVLKSDGNGLQCMEPSYRKVEAPYAAACEQARTVLEPGWEGAALDTPRAIPLLAARDGDGFRFVAPIAKSQSWPKLAEETRQPLIIALTNAGVFPRGRSETELDMRLLADSKGVVTRCWIGTSSGSDVGDLTACRIAREVARVSPRRDIFGRPYDENNVYWYARERAE